MWIVFIIMGLISGVLGSMGLGGGTILIPLLSFIGIMQKSAQVVNVFSFVVMSFFILFFYVKKGFTKVFPAIVFSILGVLSATFMSIQVQDFSSKTLKILFAVFLIIMAIFELLSFIKKYNIKK